MEELRIVTKGAPVLGMLLSVYRVAIAEHRDEEAIRQVCFSVGTLACSAIGGVVGMTCGPVGGVIGGVVGGIFGFAIGQAAGDWVSETVYPSVKSFFYDSSSAEKDSVHQHARSSL